MRENEIKIVCICVRFCLTLFYMLLLFLFLQFEIQKHAKQLISTTYFFSLFIRLFHHCHLFSDFLALLFSREYCQWMFSCMFFPLFFYFHFFLSFFESYYYSKFFLKSNQFQNSPFMFDFNDHFVSIEVISLCFVRNNTKNAFLMTNHFMYFWQFFLLM